MTGADHLNIGRPSVRIRTIALPAEHGGWGLLLEPIAMGLLLAPGWPGVLLGIMAGGAFLTRQPMKVLIGDLRRRRRSTRTPIALWLVLLYLSIAIVALTLTLGSTRTEFWLPLLFAAPLVVIQTVYDSFGRSRALTAELAATISTGAIATAIAISGGWGRAAAFALWAIVAARSVPTILYLRARLRRLHHKPAAPGVAITIHVVAVVIGLVLAYTGAAPALIIAPFVVLLLRAVLGLKAGARVTARKLGAHELIFGAMTVLAVVCSYYV